MSADSDGLRMDRRTTCVLEGVDDEWIIDDLDCADELREAIATVREDHDAEEIVETSIWLLKAYWNDNTDEVWVSAFGYNGGYEVVGE